MTSTEKVQQDKNKDLSQTSALVSAAQNLRSSQEKILAMDQQKVEKSPNCYNLFCNPKQGGKDETNHDNAACCNSNFAFRTEFLRYGILPDGCGLCVELS